MPSAERWMRGRNKSGTRAMRRARVRLIKYDVSYLVENPTLGSHLSGSSHLGRHPIMATIPQPGWQASLRGLQTERCQSLLKMWLHNGLVLFLLTICVMMGLCYYLGFGFSNSVSESDPNVQSLDKTSAWGVLLSFFFPTTCILKENQEVKACNDLQNLNESECLRYKCCYSSFGTSNFNCFAPLSDKPLQMFRMFGFVVISMITLGCLPIYCCSLCLRRKWTNSLQRKIKRILEGLKKQRKKVKRGAEMIPELAMENEEGLSDEKEQENKALFFH